MNKYYLTLNEETYDKLAEYYRLKLFEPRREGLFRELTTPFIKYLKKTFQNSRVLDVGCGSGLALRVFEKEGFEVIAIDISQKMIDVAKEVAPKTKFIKGNFLDYDFQPYLFEGIFAKSFVYLFPKDDALLVIKKMRDLLVPRGVCYISTTIHDSSREDIILRDKSEYKLYRYKHEWTEGELELALINNGFSVLCKENYSNERGETGLNLMARPLGSK
jgi:SAM-dependent methyltransferase